MPSKMNRAPMNVERLLTLQSMLKIRTPATISTSPLNSRVVQFRESRSAASRVRRWPNESNDAGVTYMWSSDRLLFSALARRGAPPAALLAGTAHLVDERMRRTGTPREIVFPLVIDLAPIRGGRAVNVELRLELRDL